jgi:hypothetical protein
MDCASSKGLLAQPELYLQIQLPLNLADRQFRSTKCHAGNGAGMSPPHFENFTRGP